MYKKISLLAMLAVLLLVQACNGMGQGRGAQVPTEVSAGFHDWYLGYTGNPVKESFRNKMSESAGRDSGYLLQPFFVELVILMAEGLFFDPVPMAQEILSNVSVDVSSEADRAVVRLQFGEYSAKDLLISLVDEDGIWKINGIYIMG